MTETEVIIKRKLGIIPKIFLFLLVIIVVLFTWMHFIEPKLLIVEDYSIESKKIPSSFKGFTIVQFSDIHFGRTTNEKEVLKIVDKINECKADIVLFSGDLFDSYIQLSDTNINFLKDAFKKINSNIGKYAVMGDQDYLNKDAFEQILEDGQFKILNGNNEAIYYQGNTPIYINGISSITKNKLDYSKAFIKEQNTFQLFLSHEPSIFDNIKNKADVVFSGHSLGGLIRLPFNGRIIKKDNISKYEKGKYIIDNSTLFVSNGIGTENYSLRFLNVPSIYCYHLQPIK